MCTGRTSGDVAKAKKMTQEFVRSIPRWPAVDVPSWMPEAARDYLRRIERIKRPKLPGDKEPPRELVIAQRLATAPKMRYVWHTLERQAPSDVNAAIWEFFYHACRTSVPVVTLADRDAGIESLSNMAAACRDRRQNDSRVRDNPRLARAFAQVENYFETDARDAKGIDLRYFARHHVKNDDSHAYVRMLGRETKRLFGATLYRTVATVATVVLERQIDWLQVRKWCSSETGKSSSAD